MSDLVIIEERKVLGKDLKVYGTKDNPLFLAKDVANWINHSDRTKMLKGVDEEEKVKNIVLTLGGNQEMWFLTEDGLYEVLMQSRKPIAKQFKKEVKKILKQIRTTGGAVC
ncbi:Bro-N domain-containing protein [Clostridium perfringens D]|nr:Bro-N domain-containing protein [Clostridium perfringens D]